MKKKNQKKPDLGTISMFCNQVAMLLRGGIPLYEGIDMLHDDYDDANTESILHDVSESIKDGCGLSEALSKTGAFPDYMINMIAIGENTGRLEDVLLGLSAYYDREHMVQLQIKSVITYPLVLFVTMSAILFVLVFRIMPIFEDVFNDLDVRTGSANAMFSYGMASSRICTGIVLIFALIILFVLIKYKFGLKKNSNFDLLNILPFTRRTALMAQKGRFLLAISVMNESGMDLDESIEKTKSVVDDTGILQNIDLCLKKSENGINIERALLETNLFTQINASMLAVGIKTGETDEVLKRVSETHDRELSEKLGSVSGYIETALVLMLSLMAGVILVSVMMPLISIISSL